MHTNMFATQVLCPVGSFQRQNSTDCDDGESSQFALFACSSVPRRMPRVLKRDPRRLYPKMLANALNSHERNTIFDFLGHFGTRDVSFVKHLPVCIRYTRSVHGPMTDVDSGINRLDLHGAQTISSYWHLLHLIRPDEVITVEDVQFQPREDGNSVIKATLFISFTRLYEECAPVLAFRAFELYGQQLCSPEEEIMEAMGLTTDFPGSFIEFLSQSPVASPVDIRLAIALTMRLNADQRISLIDFGIPAMVFN